MDLIINWQPKSGYGGPDLGVSQDPNDGMYPFAWAVVEAENTSSWTWFLKLVVEDIDMRNSGGYTFIGDKQKGLMNALEEVVPNSEYRPCVMHLYQNFWKDFKGTGLRKLVWVVAKATNMYIYDKAMDNMRKTSTAGHDWFAAKPPTQWSRAHFRTTSMSAAFVNNNCEVFNSKIKKARDKPIITMLQWIQKYVMLRIQKMYHKMLKYQLNLCPRPLQKLDRNILRSSGAIPQWNGEHRYGVTMTDGGHSVVVDLHNWTCECRKWDLTGIPCFHALACIFNQRQNPLDFVHKCYTKEIYLKVYENFIEPVGDMWPRIGIAPILPPEKHTPIRRPRKTRRKNNDIPANPNKLKRTETSLKCGTCKEWGHNIRTCPQKANSGDAQFKHYSGSQPQVTQSTQLTEISQSESQGGIFRHSTTESGIFNRGGKSYITTGALTTIVDRKMKDLGESESDTK